MTEEETTIERVTNEYYSEEFNNVNDELRTYVKRAHNEIDNVKDKVNELVVIVHNDNSKWSLKKICDYIAGRNDDLESLGFSSRTIYNYLDEENKKMLIDTGRPKRMLQNNVKEQEFESLQTNVTEQSSISGKEQQQQYQPSTSLEEFRKQHGTVEEQQEQQEELDTIYDKPFVDRLVKENAELVKQFTFDYDLEVKDQVLPLKVIVYPDKQTGVVRLRKK